MNRILEALAAQVLSLDPAQTASFADQTLIQLGGDSLQAMRLSARALEELQIQIKVGSLLGDLPLRTVLAQAAVGGAESVQHGLREAEHVATSGQQGMWFMQELLGGSPYHLLFIADLYGPLERDLLHQAICETVERHEGLRTCFRADESGLQRVVLPAHLPAIQVIQVGVGEDVATVVSRVAEEQGQRSFALQEAPPVAFMLVTNEVERHALLFCTHHMLLDGWAIGLVLDEVFRRYQALVSQEHLRLPEAPRLESLLRRQQMLKASGEYERQVSFWRSALQGIPTTLELITDHARPPRQDPSGARIPFALAKSQNEIVRLFAAQLGVTPFSLLLAAYGLLLGRYTGSRRLIVGIPWAGRAASELRELVGLCTNVVPVVIEINEEASAAEFIIAVHQSLGRSLDHADIPFGELLRELGVGGDVRRQPLVQVAFGMHDQLIDRQRRIGDLLIQIRDGHGGGSPFDMTLLVAYSDPTLGGEFEYARGVFTKTEATLFLESFLTVVEELCRNKAGQIEEVRGISLAQRKRLDALNETARPYEQSSIEALFYRQAQLCPDAVAVVCPEQEQSLTYRELEQASVMQGAKLLVAGVKPGEFVLVAIERSVAEVVAVLGVLRAGAVYVAVDPKWPDTRLRQVVEITGAKVAIANSAMAERFAGLSTGGTISLLPPWHTGWMQEAVPEIPESTPDPDRLAYVGFTSGSTGVPKGVCVRHRGVIRLVDGVGYVTCGPGERMARFAPLAFDASTLEIWCPLLNGGTIVVLAAELPAPAELGRFIVENGLTRLWITSGLFRLLAEFAPESLGGVRQLLTGGDVVSPEHVRKVLAVNPGLLLTSAYGPTENTTFTTIHPMQRVEEVEEPVPIGRPIPNTRVYVLDDRYRLLPPGAVGELFTAGDGLATGYLRNPSETERAFGRFSPDVDELLYRTGDVVRLDSQGRLQFLGRRDQQVKIRGYRIELEEIRRAILTHPNVADAVVATTGSTSEDRRLLAGAVPREHREGFLEELRDLISTLLPPYMAPSRWAVLKQIPVTSNGKVDLRALETASVALTGQLSERKESPSNIVYDRAKEILSAVLGEEHFADDDNFFDLGGDSLSLARLIATIRKRMGIELPLQEFYAHPTLRHLVELLLRADDTPSKR